MKPLTAIDLFAGSGGLTIGLKRAGFRVVGAVEIDLLASETYSLNHGDVAMAVGDIRTVTGSRLLRDVQLRKGELDLLAGCPPCQGYSTMRTRHRASSVKDARNDLVFEFARLVDETRPRAVLMENVPGLAKDPRMRRLLKELAALGYDTGDATHVLNAADYGVAQRRRRLVLMAVKGGTVALPPKQERRTVRQAIAQMPKPGNTGDRLHDMPERRSKRISNLIKSVPRNGGSRRDLGEESQLECHKRSDGFKDVYGRMAWDLPAPTITGGCHNPSKGRFLHPTQPRTITLREAAVLQGFPANYKFSSNAGKLAIAAMIGNALPPPFGHAHAAAIAASLQSSVVS